MKEFTHKTAFVSARYDIRTVAKWYQNRGEVVSESWRCGIVIGPAWHRNGAENGGFSGMKASKLLKNKGSEKSRLKSLARSKKGARSA